jgi:hypothetical protein
MAGRINIEASVRSTNPRHGAPIAQLGLSVKIHRMNVPLL